MLKECSLNLGFSNQAGPPLTFFVWLSLINTQTRADASSLPSSASGFYIPFSAPQQHFNVSKLPNPTTRPSPRTPRQRSLQHQEQQQQQHKQQQQQQQVHVSVQQRADVHAKYCTRHIKMHECTPTPTDTCWYSRTRTGNSSSSSRKDKMEIRSRTLIRYTFWKSQLYRLFMQSSELTFQNVCRPHRHSRSLTNWASILSTRCSNTSRCNCTYRHSNTTNLLCNCSWMK